MHRTSDSCKRGGVQAVCLLNATRCDKQRVVAANAELLPHFCHIVAANNLVEVRLADHWCWLARWIEDVCTARLVANVQVALHTSKEQKARNDCSKNKKPNARPSNQTSS